MATIVILKVKIHLCGIAIKYDPTKRVDHRPTSLPSRNQGSLYGWQKRKIADACTWMYNNSEYPLIFCLTSPGFTSIANTTDVLSKFVNNARKQGMKHYVWVRELTKRGYPHFHFIADWHGVDYWFKKEDGFTNINRLSRYWSGLCGSEADNSIRLGSYHPDTKRRTYYLEHSKQTWYLAKYIGKNIGETSLDYLCEAGFPAVTLRKTTRSFCVSPDLAQLSQPVEFESQPIYLFEQREVMTTKGLQTIPWQVDYQRGWESPKAGFRDNVLVDYSWRWTGHGQTFIGYLKKNRKNPIE